MGYDGHIQLLDPAEQTRLIRTWAKRTEDLAYTLDELPRWARRIRRSTAETVELLDSLEEPPACNRCVSDLLRHLQLPFNPDQPDRTGVHVWGSSSSSVLAVVPEFIARYSKTGAALWRKLLGDAEYYEIELASRAYRFDGRSGGYLTPTERDRLQAELQPVLAHTDAFYEAVDDEYDSRVMVREIAIIECVYALCAMANDGGRRAGDYGIGYRCSY